MLRPNDRLFCSRCQEQVHGPAAEDSDDQTTTSTASGSDDVRESDDEFVEIDSDGWHSTEDYEESAATSAGSSDRWEEEGGEQDDEELDPSVTPNDDLVNVSDVLDVTSQHESSIANLSVVLARWR